MRVRHRNALRKEVENDVELLAKHLMTSGRRRPMVTAISDRIYDDLKKIQVLNQSIEALSGPKEIDQEVFDNHNWARNIEDRLIKLGGLRRSLRRVLSRWIARHGPLFARALGKGGAASAAASSQDVQCNC